MPEYKIKYKAIKKVLSQSLGPAHDEKLLRACTSATDAACTLPVLHTITSVFEDAGPRDECPDGFTPMPADEPTACKLAWDHHFATALRERDVKGFVGHPSHRVWHELEWDDSNRAGAPALTAGERASCV